MKNIQFENDILVIPDTFNKLKIIESDGEKFLKGEVDIIDNEGKVWDVYQVEIRSSEEYPFRFPKLFEKGDAFPKIVDWHVYEFDDKSCCVDVTPNEILICKKGLNVLEYIQRFAIPYLANQTYRKREGYYLYGEYSHGIMGRVEFYQSKLKAQNLLQLIQMIALILKGYNPYRTSICPFCHKSKFRRCHKNVFVELQDVSWILSQDIEVLHQLYSRFPDFKLPNI
ncbi:hypothetical protein [Sphingobacterium hungaricum]|uniref:SEC-C motif-containing protein n=1 Tax=Sphingobacterium hungaricum TaxID=2082723 RepID=A0A928YRK8_9SPHI|nr:hypothetical protein [Sphingobacterium hungaricum]MBE8715094.1 hypothetical protein [Sphingobacterium hungaricum]